MNYKKKKKKKGNIDYSISAISLEVVLKTGMM